MKTTDVAIIGGGPAGLMLAIELGCRGVDCVVLEEDIAAPDFPKANATSSRTMEHYRRRGFAGQIRSLGLAADHPQDVVYCTTLAGRELTRFSIPSRSQALSRTSFGDYGEESWPTPELPHRGQQMFIEPVLRAQAQQYACVRLMLGYQAESIAMDEQQVRIAGRHAESRETFALNARYVVGCDGPRSLVRKTCGIRYSGQSEEARDFFGGQMLSVYFTSRTLYQVLGKEKAWQYWAVNAVQRGLLIAIDGIDQFLFCLQLSAGQTPESVDFRAAMFAAIGREFAFELIATGPWHAGFTLVADRFCKGRAFIAGDAAHLFTPTGGMGYNTSVDDAVNLGWKLAAVVKGWAGEELLDSYEAERKPIAQRNTTFARAMADSIGGIKVPPNVDAEGLDAERVRQQLGDALHRHVRNEFNIPGLQLGLRYEGSPIVASEAGARTLDEPNHYLPSARPGARAPHIWLDGTSIFDLFGRDYTLLCFTASDHNAPPADALAWQAAAAAMNVPLALVCCSSLDARALYGADRVLVRPDHHVAWRGDASADAPALLAMACARECHRVLQPIAA
uniref:FAD-dependent monooxygenase n=1 Tax=Polaromonas sp. TaxID=1869339 RepID=UPI00159A0C41|nr:FAD-dependent monooxygenase [Polaromonas sp.]QJS06427.1 2-polyprenyl-6-methoxyphenol hydroxylase [Polaromonas sp.]